MQFFAELTVKDATLTPQRPANSARNTAPTTENLSTCTSLRIDSSVEIDRDVGKAEKCSANAVGDRTT